MYMKRRVYIRQYKSFKSDKGFLVEGPDRVCSTFFLLHLCERFVCPESGGEVRILNTRQSSTGLDLTWGRQQSTYRY